MNCCVGINIIIILQKINEEDEEGRITDGDLDIKYVHIASKKVLSSAVNNFSIIIRNPFEGYSLLFSDLEDQSHDTNSESYDRSPDLLSKDFGNEGRTSEVSSYTFTTRRMGLVAMNKK